MKSNSSCIRCDADLKDNGYELHSINQRQVNDNLLIICANCRTTYVLVNVVMLGNLVQYLQPVELSPVQMGRISDGLDKHLAKLGSIDNFKIQGLSDKEANGLKREINNADTVNQFLDSIKNKKPE